MLHIRKLLLNNFATHAKTALSLPQNGLTAITGANGAGKSSMLECIAGALWNESLRGEMGWREGEAGALEVETDGLIATRKRSKAGSTKLEWQRLDHASTTYETSSKAQAAMEALIGSYDVWRRTCVLSSLDSAAFSLARDSDRKRLLEEFLGLDQFDVALEACRKDRRTASAKAQKAEAERTDINLRLSFAQTQLTQALKDQQDLLSETGGKDAASLKTEGKRISELAQKAKDAADAAATAIKDLERSGIEQAAQAKAEKMRLSTLGVGACPTCGQDAQHVRQHLEQIVAKAQEAVEQHKRKIEAEVAILKEEHVELGEEHQRLEAKLQRLRSDYAVAESQAKLRLAATERLQKAQDDVKHWTEKLQAIGTTAEDAAIEAQYLEAVEQVLGLRGVRAQILDTALSALESQANAWLSRLPTDAGALTISLTGSTTQKNGNVVDAISLRVRQRPYASLSGGERRRVDVALLLALRELAVGAHGRDGTLFCDEVFDALDQQGQTDVAAALREMAKDRLVVVISHSPDLVRALAPDLHLHVSLNQGTAKVN